MKWQLFVYDWSGRNEKRWLSKQLRRIGEPPVILDTTLVEQSTDELRRFFINKGYVNAEVSAEILRGRRRRLSFIRLIRMSLTGYIIIRWNWMIRKLTVLPI